MSQMNLATINTTVSFKCNFYLLNNKTDKDFQNIDIDSDIGSNTYYNTPNTNFFD